MSRLLKPLLYAAVVLCIGVSCKKEDRTTVVFGKVTDNFTNQPIEKMKFWIRGEKGILSANQRTLDTVYTNALGEYSIVIDVSKDYHSLDVINRYIDNPSFRMTYKGAVIYFNGNQTNDCCPAKIGQKNEYNFAMIRK